MTVQIDEILNAAKKGAGVGSDYALAEALGVKKQTVSRYRHGVAYPEAVVCEKLAIFSGYPLHVVLGIVGEARAISTDEKRVWRKLAAALFVSLVAVPTVYARPTNGQSEATNGSGAMYIMRSLIRFARDVARQFATLARRFGDRHAPLPAL